MKKVCGYESNASSKSDNPCYYAQYLFDLLDQNVAKKRDMDFFYDLCEKVNDFMDDDNLNEMELRKMGVPESA